jgi:transposase
LGDLRIGLHQLLLRGAGHAWTEITQGLADWIGSHTRAFAFIGGVSAMVVSDNLKSGITKAYFYHHQGILLRAGGES